MRVNMKWDAWKIGYAVLAAVLGCACCCPQLHADEITVKGGNGRVVVRTGGQRQIGLFGRWMQDRAERKAAEAKAKEPKIIMVPEGSRLLGTAETLPCPMPPRPLPRVVLE